MKRLFCLSLLSALLAACSTTSEIPPESRGPGQAVSEGPLVVPTTLPDTPPRALAGRYQRAAWSELPGWESDDLSRLWPLVLRNCKGLVRPASGNLTVPARATPRAWQIGRAS
ncbi:hypothetical protein ACLQ9F_05185, partial [Bordetella avium]